MNLQTEAPPLEVDTERSVGRSVELRPGHHETYVSVTFHNSPQQRSHRQDEAPRDDISRPGKNLSMQSELFPDGDSQQYKSMDRNVWDRLKNRTLEHEPSFGASHSEIMKAARDIADVIETGVGVAREETFVQNVLEPSKVNATPSVQDNHHQQDKENYYQATNDMFAHNVLEPMEINATPNTEKKHQQQNKENYCQPVDIHQIYEQEPLTRGQDLPPWDDQQNSKTTKLQLSSVSKVHFNRYHWEKGTRKEGSSWKSVPEVILHGVPKDVRFLFLNVRPLHTKLNRKQKRHHRQMCSTSLNDAIRTKIGKHQRKKFSFLFPVTFAYYEYSFWLQDRLRLSEGRQ